MIIGRDLLSTLGIIIDFDNQMIEWQGTRIPMRDVDEDPKDHVYVTDSPHVESATERIKQILDAKYEPANIEVELQRCTHLSDEEKQMLRRILNKHYRIFDGSLGKCCLLYTSPSPRDGATSRMPSSA